MAKNTLAKIVLGAAAILVPAVMPEMPIFNHSKVYAEEKKPDFLEKKIHSEIKRLKKKEDKTVDEYLRLVDLSYDFEKDKDKIKALIEETKKSIDKETPQYKYLDALSEWLIGAQYKGNDAVPIRNQIQTDKNLSPRVKSNLLRRIWYGGYQKENLTASLKADNTNLAAHLDFLSFYFDKVSEFKPSLDILMTKKIYYRHQLDQKVQEFIKEYEKACRQFNANKDQPETPYYTVKIHEIMIEILKKAFEKQEGLLKNSIMSAYDYYPKYVKKTDKCYDALIKIHPIYENYMGKGFLNYELKKQIGFKSDDLKRCDEAFKAFESAEKLAMTDKEKGTALLYQGLSLCDKANFTDFFKWKNHGIKTRRRHIKINATQKKLAKKALGILKQCWQYLGEEDEPLRIKGRRAVGDIKDRLNIR